MISPPHSHAICGVTDVKNIFTLQIKYQVYKILGIAVNVGLNLKAL
jgi:hypothetical protein